MINESLYYPPLMNIPSQKVEPERTFTLEYMALAVLALYLLAFYIGKRKNESYAINWMKFLKPIFDLNFVHVGVTDK